MVEEGGGTRRCAHPAPASAFRERKAGRGGHGRGRDGRGGDGTGRSGGVAALSLPAVELRPRCESFLPGASPDGAPAPLRSAHSGAASLSSPAEKPRPAAPAARGRGRVGQISPPHPPLPRLHRRGPGSIGGRLLPTAPRPPPAQGEALGPGG